jgi:hypothetical protein
MGHGWIILRIAAMDEEGIPMGPAARTLLALAAFAFSADCGAAQWKQIAKSKLGELWIDNESIKRNEGAAAFDYRVDYGKPQQEVGSKTMYRSTVTRAIMRCAPRTLSMGPTLAYAGARATGKVIGNYPPSPEEARFQPVEPNSSDENLWRHICGVAQLSPKK